MEVNLGDSAAAISDDGGFEDEEVGAGLPSKTKVMMRRRLTS